MDLLDALTAALDKIDPVKPLGRVAPAEPPAFDPFNDAHIKNVIPEEAGDIRDSLAMLLIATKQINDYANSFGVDKAKAYDALMPILNDLYRDMEFTWRAGW